MTAHSFRPGVPGSPEVVVDNSMLRGVRVTVDGRPIARRRERGRPWWPIPLAGGGEAKLYVTGTITGLRAFIGGEEIMLERRLAWWELLLAFLPLALVSIGGVIGGIVGAIGSLVGLWVMRRPWHAASRVTAALGVVAFSVAAWWVTLLVLQGLLAAVAPG